MSICKEKKLNYKGFTLIELLITVAISGILMSVGIPSFNEIIKNSRLTSNANELVTALNFSRSEAIKRNQTITIRKSGTEWESGWTVFVDWDEDGVFDTGDGDEVLRNYSSMPSNFTLRSTGINRVTYQVSGISGNGSFVLCDNSDGNNVPEANTSRLVIINTVGRVRMGTDDDNDGVPEKEDGSEITSCTVSPFT